MTDRMTQLEHEFLSLKERLAATELAARRRGRRLVAANIVLAIAVLSIGGAGAAYALAAANSVNSASIIDGSIITPDLKDGALSGTKILDNAVTGADVNEATLSPRTFFAQVTSSGSAASASPGVTSERTGAGLYRLTFPRNMQACSATANPGFFGATGTSVTIVHELVEVGASSYTAAGTNQVGVMFKKPDLANTDTAFLLIAACP